MSAPWRDPDEERGPDDEPQSWKRPYAYGCAVTVVGWLVIVLAARVLVKYLGG